MDQVSLGALIDEWRHACAADEGDADATWAEQESATLLESILGAGGPASATEPDPPSPAERFSAVDRASRNWARRQSSLPTLTLRLSHLRQVLATDVSEEPQAENLDNLCLTVVATANEEFVLRLQQAALTDPLTGVGNRRALEGAWEAAVIRAGRLAQPVCLVAIDLDGLKRINDFQGHAAGDEAIINLCAALRSALRTTDEVFRIGGDEFVALLPGTAAAAVGELMARLVQYHAPRCSWGAADTVQDGANLDDVLGCADRRLYAQRRRNRPATTALGAVTLTPRVSPWSRLSARRAVELAITGALALAIGAIIVSISGGNHSLCAGGDGPTVVDCGLSNAVYYGGIILMTAGGIVFGVGVVARALRQVTEQS